MNRTGRSRIMLTMDQHFPDAPYVSFDAFSAREEVANAVEAGYDGLFIFTKCHWGYTYHPTNHGVMHPALAGRDIVGELVTECRAAGVEAIAYHSIVFDQAMTALHPEWCLKTRTGDQVIWNREGNPLFGANAQPDPTAGAQSWRFREACVNTGYRRFTLDLIEEFSRAYEFDGIFVDIFGVTTSCWCDSCRKLMAERKVPADGDGRRDVFARTELWWDSWERFMVEIRSVMDAERPGMSLSINGTLPGRILRHATFPYSEGGEHPHNMDLLRGCRMTDYQGGIGSPMHDPKSSDLLKLQSSTIASHGGRLLYFWGPGRSTSGVMERHWFDHLAPLNRETLRILDAIDGSESVPSVAVYHHDACASDVESSHHLSWMNLWKGISGILSTFRSLHVPCDFLPNWRLTPEAAAAYRLIIVPEITCISDRDRDILAGYVAAGGTLLVTGDSGRYDERGEPRPVRAFDELLGIESRGANHQYDVNTVGGYLVPSADPLLATLPGEFRYLMGGPFEMASLTDARPVAMIAEPLAVETPEAFVGWQPLPPGSTARWPAVTVADRERGRAIWCAAPLGRYTFERMRWPRLVLAGVAASVGADLGIRFSGPASAMDTVIRRRGARELIVQILNRTAEGARGVCEPLSGVGVSFDPRQWKPVSATVVYPDPGELAAPVSLRDGTVSLPPLSTHTILVIEQEV